MARKSKLMRLEGSVDDVFSVSERILVRVALFGIFVFGLVKILRILLWL